MVSSPTLSRRILITLVVGIFLGFSTTYLLFNSSGNHGPNDRSRKLMPFRVPKSPHTQGELTDDQGPEKEQSWNDFEADNHHGNDEVAQELYKKVRVLCWVMTSPENLNSKARHIKATWGKRCNKLVFMSSEDDPSFPAVGLKVPEGRDFLWGKTREAFKYLYDHHYDNAEWFLKADDDTYIILENLRFLLKEYKPTDPMYFGRRFKPYVHQGYMSGGAGYVLSKEAVRRFIVKGMTDGRYCRQDPGGAEDLEMGQCMQNIGVEAMDARDELGRETFHPFYPELHLIPGLVPKDNWYWEYSYYTPKEGPECCSDNAISFHYVPPNLMYVFEYMIYHLKPYGINSKVVLPMGQSAAAKYKTPPGSDRNANEILPDIHGDQSPAPDIAVPVIDKLNSNIKIIQKPKRPPTTLPSQLVNLVDPRDRLPLSSKEQRKLKSEDKRDKG